MTARKAWPLWLLIIAAAVLATLIPSGASATVDDDGDKIVNTVDKCPKTPKGEEVDKFGCSASQDADKDGVRDGSDKCPDTKAGAKVDVHGCSKEQRASDEPAPCKPNAAIAAALGVKQARLATGDDLSWDAVPETDPRNEFSPTDLRSKSELKKFLNGKSLGSREARKLLKSALSAKEYKRALSGKGFKAVQLKPGDPVKLKGNYQLIDRKVVKRASVSQTAEVLWVYVPSTCDGSKVAITVAVRSWCGNPQLFARRS